MKGKHRSKANLSIGSGSQKRSFSVSSSASRPNRPNKKAKHTPNQNQKKDDHDATASPSNQAKTALTAAQVYNRNNIIPGTSNSDKTDATPTKQENSGVAPAKQETARSTPILPNKTGFTPIKQDNTPFTSAEKEEPDFTPTKQERAGFTPILPKKTSFSPIIKTTLAAANEPTKTELTNMQVNKKAVANGFSLKIKATAKAISNKAKITNKRVMDDNSSKLQVNVDGVTALGRRNLELGTAKSESESSSSSVSKEDEIDGEQPGSKSDRTLRTFVEIVNSMSDSGSSDDEDEEPTLSVKATTIAAQPTKLRGLDSSSSESKSSGDERDEVAILAKVKTTPATITNAKLVHKPFNDTDKDENQPNMNTDLKSIPTPQPKTTEVRSPSSESGYHGDIDQERPTIETRNEPTQAPQPKIIEVDTSSSGSASDSDDDVEMHNRAKIEDVSYSESGKDSSGVEKRIAGEAEDEWEDADISSEESSVKHPSSATSTPGLSNAPKALSPLFNANGKPCSLSVEVAPSLCYSATPALSKSPQTLVSHKSEPCKITTSVGKFTSKPSLVESVKVEMRQDRETSRIAQIPVWFSQKVRKILEGPNCSDTMESKDINRLTHYRAWLEGVRHRRWQRYNLADEKRTRLTDLLLKYKVEGRNMEAYRHRFLQRGMWKRDALRAFKRLEKLVKGIKLLDETLDTVFTQKQKEARKWLSIQRIAKGSEKRHSMI